MRFLTIIAAIFMLFANDAAAAAKGTFYECNITKRRKDVDWVQPLMGFVFQPDGKVLVIDRVILYYHGQPMVAKVVKRNGEYVIRWNVAVEDSARSIFRFSYVARFNPESGAIKVTANPVGPPQRWSGSGTCQVRKSVPKEFRRR